jgi:hypothetical protein
LANGRPPDSRIQKIWSCVPGETESPGHTDAPGSIGVLESLDKFMLIGEASCRTHDENGLAVWTLRIGKEEIPGRWVIIDREFKRTI